MSLEGIVPAVEDHIDFLDTIRREDVFVFDKFVLWMVGCDRNKRCGDTFECCYGNGNLSLAP